MNDNFYDATVKETNSEFTLSKVFSWLFIALGVTALTSWGFAALITAGFITADAYLAIMIAAIVLMFVETFVIQFRVIRDNKPLVVPYVIYAITMGLMLSSIVAYIDSWLIIISFGVTAGLFGVMALYGYVTKRSLNRMGSMAFAFLFGALLVSLINIFMRSTTIDWIVSFVTFGAIMLFISYDMWRVKQILNSGYGTSNLCLYCAFQLYVDFMYIFIRVLSIVVRLYGNNR